MKKLLNSLAGRLLCAGVMLAMVVSLLTDGAQVLVVGWLTAPWDKLAHVAAFAVLTALLALALQATPPQPGARWALRPGAALAVAAVLAGAVGVADELRQATLPGSVASWGDLLANFVGVGLGLWVARWCWR